MSALKLMAWMLVKAEVELWGSSHGSDLSILVEISPLNKNLSHKREQVNLY